MNFNFIEFQFIVSILIETIFFQVIYGWYDEVETGLNIIIDIVQKV